MGLWISTKTYTHSEGLSCCYRQWRATDRSSMLHGFALSFKLVFECHNLDDNNRVIDFASLDHVKDWLASQYDNTTCIAENDPELDTFRLLADKKLLDLRILPGVGCEQFAEQTFKYVIHWLIRSEMIKRVTIRSVECIEHDGNSALFVE